ncbi:hypothetical protein ILUMI_19783 [Ignelater luminosus]|uniref:Prolyl 4-hydroxylase N-terminal domain-containing protein n=1 Tax=Ignelater luminosus TaxID=2038154 RepID=A0A8K0CMA0_IGNLU|nr:hypothetical protein ILUMI_19783 [Ignelater luminosus]
MIFVFILLASYSTLCKPELEGAFIKDVRYFLEYEKNVLKELKEFRDSVQEIHNRANKDPYFFEDPFNNFKVVKRIILDWHYFTALSTFHKYEFMKGKNFSGLVDFSVSCVAHLFWMLRRHTLVRNHKKLAKSKKTNFRFREV